MAHYGRALSGLLLILALACSLTFPFVWGGKSGIANAASEVRNALPLPARNRHEQLLLWLKQNPQPAPSYIAPIIPADPKISNSPLITHPQSPRLVIVIDDLGNHLERGQRSVLLPGKVSMAILPFTPHAQQLAQSAHQAGKETLLHAPMENHQKLPLGPGALTLAMDRQQFIRQLQQSIDSLPNISGINNHMGSLMTEQTRQMAWTMSVLKEKDLFFLDSRTSAETVAADTAREFGIPHLSRTIFLDHDRDPEAIASAFDRGVSFARKFGAAVLIGHPYPQTLELLEQRLPTLGEQGVQLVTVNQLIGQQRLSELQP